MVLDSYSAFLILLTLCRHEHIYKSIEERLIRSDELPDNPTGLARVLLGSQIILSTISMLSNPCLENNGMFRLVPMERLIIDEASQINVFEYLVRRFSTSLYNSHL